MEVVVGGGGRRRMSTPERSRMGFQEERDQERKRALLTSRKVQIVYYLCRNGQLEHPHFMELSQLPNQQLRLKDVMEKLSVLRGVGMPSLFSWSCKRSYKNGYVWNDLSENDVVYPADGAEYVLKGSEVISGCSSDRFQEFPLINNRHPKPPMMISSSTRRHHRVVEEEEEEEAEIGKQQDSTNSHCSRGVSTAEDIIVVPKSQTEITIDDGSPALSSSSSDPAVAAEPGSGMTRNSVLLQLIACGGSSAVGGRKSGSLHDGVLSRAAAAASRSRVDNDVDEENNAMFGCLRGIGDKEYFSGSIVEVSRKPADSPEPKLKRSSSFNEQRGSKLGFGEGEGLDLDIIKEREGVKGKCIPGRKKRSSSFKLPQIQWQVKK